MPTNIIDGRADAVGPSGWSTVGGGLGQLGQLLAATMGAAAADKKAKAAGAPVAIPGAVDPNSNMGPGAAIPEMDPGVLGNPSADLAKLTAAAPAPPNQFMPGGNDMGFRLNRDVSGGLGGILPQRFPGLFPQRNLIQYGGL